MDNNTMKLLEHFYQVAVDPYNFDNLLSEWDRTLKNGIEDQSRQPDLEILGHHANRATQILEKLDLSQVGETTPRLSDVIEIDPNAAMLLASDGKVIAANSKARALGVRLARPLAASLTIELKAQSYMKELVNRVNDKAEETSGLLGLLTVTSKAQDQTMLLAISVARCKVDEKVALLVTALAPIWRQQTRNAVKEHFGLTATEMDIVILMMEGNDAAQIATSRHTSLHTVRSQIKSILAKSGCSSQLELVQHLGCLQRFEPASDHVRHASSPRDDSLARDDSLECRASARHTLTLSNGRKLDYVLVGPKGGMPVLFIHGIVDSNNFPDIIIEQLFKRSICLIAPARPNYGNSDPCRSERKLLNDFAAYACELLDELNIKRLPVMGHMAGTLYAIALAAKYPERVSSILSVAGAIPMVHRWQFTGMSYGHKIAGLTARHAPMLIAILTRAGIGLIRRGEKARMLKLLFKDAPLDLKVANPPEMQELIFERFDFVTCQGHQAFKCDLIQVSRDWSRLVENLNCPLSIVHGAHDRVVLIEGVRKFAATYAECQLTISPHSGQLIFCNEPVLVFDKLDQLIELSP